MFSKTLLIGQRIALGFATALLALLVIGYFSLRNVTGMQQETAWVGHTLEALSEVSVLNDSVSRLESAGRGYLLSGEPAMKAEVMAQRDNAVAALRQLQFLTLDNAAQQFRLSALRALLDRRLAAAEETIALRDAGQSAGSRRATALIVEGQSISANFRALSAALAEEENRLLTLREESSRRATALTRDTVIYGSLAAFGFVLVGGFFLTRSVTGPLAQLGKSAKRIGAGDYAHRATVEREDELGHLGGVFNEMAGQVEQRQTALQSLTNRLEAQQSVLEEQQVELTQSNEEMEQTNEELEQANEEMEEKSTLLAAQKRELEDSNRVIERARADLQEQARQLMISSTYKSNFLATMSHELRTPLNSLLILARLLAENREGNLTSKQVQFARTIESSGSDLLEMINQVLDLAKIESGTVELQPDDVLVGDVKRSLENQFRPVAESKHLGFAVHLGAGLPEHLHTDVGRLHQVLKNLLSNAFKFTERGSVRVDIRMVTAGWPRGAGGLDKGGAAIAFSVADTGIGIPPEKQGIIFESFQQADAGVSRRFGGTGLGLSISREIALMLGGALRLESAVGEGSTFTFFIPARLDLEALPGKAASGIRLRTERMAPGPGALRDPSSPRFATTAKRDAAPSASPIPATEDTAAATLEFDELGVDDDRHAIRPGDRMLLIIEDDPRFAAILVDFAREKRFKALVAGTAHRGLALARRFVPAAITLDLHLADEDGWHVLDSLKHEEGTRHIPVHVISVDPSRTRGRRLGAVSYLQKPVTREAIDEVFRQTIDFLDRPMKNLLVVEDDPVQRRTICELIGNGDVHTTAVATAAQALEALARVGYDCIVMDLVLPDQAGSELIREINRRLGHRSPPVIVYTGKALSPQEETELRALSESIIVKDARSPERLLDETALFLHRVQARLPEAKRRMLEQVRKQDAVLTGRRVLIVDDDVRNIFALTAALENYGMVVQFAESGQAALDRLRSGPDFDAVLMDIMMPGMDGNEATRRLRAEGRFANLPIIAVTAKAMKGDRERSIEAGASDYITKPVDTEKLISLLRVWLYR